MRNPVKQFENNLDFNHQSPNSNCPSLYEPLISSNGIKNATHYSTQFDHHQATSLLDPSNALSNDTKLIKDSSVQSVFSQHHQTNFLKPPCSRATTASISNLASKIGTPNLSNAGTTNRLLGSSNLNLKTDLTPSNLRRRCIAKNGVANIRNAKISRKSQRFFLGKF